MLTRPVASREVVSRRCAVAMAAGIAEGMDLAHARTLLPASVGLHVEAHRADRDEAALHALACWALRFSPVVAPDPPDGLLIDITGTERLHRGEGRVIRAAAAGVQRLGFAVRVAAGPTFGCAWGVARFGKHALSCVPGGREREAIENLPVAALRVDERTVSGLAEIGIVRVGEVLHLPRASIAARFDPTLLARVHQALGEATESIEPVRPMPPPSSELIFDGPTTQWESIEAAAKRTLEGLAEELARLQRGVRRADFTLRRPYAEPIRIEISLSRPSRVMKHLWSLLRSRLERVDLSEGIDGMTLTASRTGRLRHEQLASDGLGVPDDRRPEAAWGELVDTLVGRLGPDQVVRIEAVESHLPELAFRTRSVMESQERDGWAGVSGADRPTTLFAKPEPATAVVMMPDGPILSVGWRGERLGVIACRGPERIAPEWWRWGTPREAEERASERGRGRGSRATAAPSPPPPPDRDYFAAQMEDGRWLWLCRHAGTGRWFVHGEWN